MVNQQIMLQGSTNGSLRYVNGLITWSFNLVLIILLSVRVLADFVIGKTEWSLASKSPVCSFWPR